MKNSSTCTGAIPVRDREGHVCHAARLRTGLSQVFLIACILSILVITTPIIAFGQAEFMNRYACTDTLYQYTPVTARPAQPDSTVFVWVSGDGDSTTLYAQKVDNVSGLPQWTPYDGVPVCTVEGHKRNPVAVYDTMGGVIIGWEDYRHRIGAPLDADSTSCEIYAQRLFLHDGRQDPAWNTGGSGLGLPVCAGTNASARHLRMAGIPDGAYFAWTDYRNSSGYPDYDNRDVYCQYMLSLMAAPPQGGNWVRNGIRATHQSDANQQYPDVCADFVRDGATRFGCYLVYEDDSDGTLRVRANTVLSDGTFNRNFDDGSSTDIRLSSVDATERRPRIASSAVLGEEKAPNGVIAVWEHIDGAGGETDIHGQQFDEQAALLVSPDIEVCTATGMQVDACVAACDAQAVVAWEDHRTFSTLGIDVYANVIDLTTGDPESASGSCLAQSTAVYDQESPDADFDFGRDMMYVCWEDHRDSLTSGADIYAQGIDCLYPTQLRWGSGGRRVSVYRGDQVLPHIAGEVVVWQDGRRTAITGDSRVDTDVYCELFGNECDYVTEMHWRDVYAKHTSGNAAEEHRMAADAEGNRYMIWSEERGSAGGKAVWAQKFDRWGVPRWSNDGVILSDDQRYASTPDVCPDGEGGAYAVWLEENQEVKLTRISARGVSAQTVDVSANGSEPRVVENRTLGTIGGCFVAHIDGAYVIITRYSPGLQSSTPQSYNLTSPVNLKLTTNYENGVWFGAIAGGALNVGFCDGSSKAAPSSVSDVLDYDIVTDRFAYRNTLIKTKGDADYDLLVANVASNNGKLEVRRFGEDDGNIYLLGSALTLADNLSYVNWQGTCSPAIAIDSVDTYPADGDQDIGGAIVAWANRYENTITQIQYYQVQTNRVVWDWDANSGYVWSRDFSVSPAMAPILDSVLTFEPRIDIAMMPNGFDENDPGYRFGMVIWETDRRQGCSPSYRTIAAQRVNYSIPYTAPGDPRKIWGSYGKPLSPGIGVYQQTEPVALTPEIGAEERGVPVIWLDERSDWPCLLGTTVYDADGEIAWEKEVVESIPPSILIAIDLDAVYPNPVPEGAVCDIRLTVEGASRSVRLNIHDILGRLRACIMDRHVDAGSHTVRFDPSGAGLPAGMYRLVLNDGERVVTRPLLLLK